MTVTDHRACAATLGNIFADEIQPEMVPPSMADENGILEAEFEVQNPFYVSVFGALPEISFGYSLPFEPREPVGEDKTVEFPKISLIDSIIPTHRNQNVCRQLFPRERFDVIADPLAFATSAEEEGDDEVETNDHLPF